MTAQEKDRIERAICHIESSLDVDPWAVEIAVEAMKKQLPQKLGPKVLDYHGRTRLSVVIAVKL